MIQFLKKHLDGIPLRVQLWDGRKVDLIHHPKVTLTLLKPSALRHLFYPSLQGLSSAYVDEEIRVEGSTPEVLKVLNTVATQDTQVPPSLMNRMIRGPVNQVIARTVGRTELWLQRFQELTTRQEEISSDYYSLWLDRHRIYSTAYFRTGTEDLNTAQEQKLDLICKKLMLASGDRLLDLGCGWGALIRWAVTHYDIKATGVTTQRNQHEAINELLKREKLEKKCKVLLCDYQDLKTHFEKESFDKAVSIGVYEHIGIKHLPRFYGVVNHLLRPGGIFLHQAISSAGIDPERAEQVRTGHLIHHGLFLDGQIGHIATTERHLAEQFFEIADVESLRPHHVKTLLHWLSRLEQNEEEAKALVGDRIFRTWRAYLICSALSFERGWMSVHQTLSFKRTDAGIWPLPWTREHVYITQPTKEKAEKVA